MNWRTIILPVVRFYWRIFRPRTYGVKVLIFHPDGSKRVLLVRHSYGNTTLWNLPGGGFNPRKESAINASIREVMEELGSELINPQEFYTYYTEKEGKRDKVLVFRGSLNKIDFVTGGEISDYVWMDINEILSDGEGVARIARYAIKHLDE